LEIYYLDVYTGLKKVYPSINAKRSLFYLNPYNAMRKMASYPYKRECFESDHFHLFKMIQKIHEILKVRRINV